MLKTYFELKQLTLRFQNEKTYTVKYAKDGGFYFKKREGLFNKFATAKAYRPTRAFDHVMDG